MFFKKVFLSFFIFGFFNLVPSNAEKPFIEADMRGQLGNHMFIVATTYALAWDNGAEAYFPQLNYMYASEATLGPKSTVLNKEHVFFRCNLDTPPKEAENVWVEPIFSHHHIPFQKNMKLSGYFQSEKYFAHHREKILEKFAPLPKDLEYMQFKYRWLIEHPNTVGVHVRVNHEEAKGIVHNQYGEDYLRKAMTLFPKDAHFIIFTNGIEFARDNTPNEMRNRVVYIENEPHYIDLHLLSLCKHNILTNSTFGWWGAWMNQNPDKIVVAPKVWLNPQTGTPTQDVIPENWIKLEAKSGPLIDKTSYR